MATVAERREAAVVGALVADAAIQPLHWIYNEEKLTDLIKDRDDIEFWTPSANPFYCLETGLNSCYGDQSFVILKSLVQSQGVDVEDLKKATYDRFGPKSDYESAVNAAYAGTKEKKLTSADLPLKGPWRHASIKHFLKNFESKMEETGSETDEQIDCVLRMVPVVALYAGRPEMLDKVENVLRVTQNFDTAVSIGLAAARILEYYIVHGPSPSVVDQVISQLEDPHRQAPQDLDRAVISFLKEVKACTDKPHHTVVTEKFRKD
ncbi:crystallin J1A-like [Haliotis rufescens]|uniref:crystallin J1A-like n=1 Tax=Haliotis rufescens TaxID=6454 RepID=UPI001EB09B41|nr:crystallin J1A-like [Haliotis rufescens]